MQNTIFDLLMEAGTRIRHQALRHPAMLAMAVEKSYRLIGRELSIEYAALESGLDRFVHPNKGEFLGRDALVEWRERGFRNRFVTMEVHDVTDADARGSEPILLKGELVGRCTSGGYGWRVGKSLALGMVRPDLGEIGQELDVQILGRPHRATIIAESPYDPGEQEAAGMTDGRDRVLARTLRHARRVGGGSDRTALHLRVDAPGLLHHGPVRPCPFRGGASPDGVRPRSLHLGLLSDSRSSLGLWLGGELALIALFNLARLAILAYRIRGADFSRGPTSVEWGLIFLSSGVSSLALLAAGIGRRHRRIHLARLSGAVHRDVAAGQQHLDLVGTGAARPRRRNLEGAHG